MPLYSGIEVWEGLHRVGSAINPVVCISASGRGRVWCANHLANHRQNCHVLPSILVLLKRVNNIPLVWFPSPPPPQARSACSTWSSTPSWGSSSAWTWPCSTRHWTPRWSRPTPLAKRGVASYRTLVSQVPSLFIVPIISQFIHLCSHFVYRSDYSYIYSSVVWSFIYWIPLYWFLFSRYYLFLIYIVSLLYLHSAG